MDERYLHALLSSLLSTVFFIFLVALLGLALGAITIKGVSLGTAGVLIIAIILGVIYDIKANSEEITQFTIYKKKIIFWSKDVKSLYSLVSSIGTNLFVSAVGLIAGPKFFRSFNRQMLYYILMSVIIILIDVAITIVINVLDSDLDMAMATGILTGALTSTPGLSAGKEAAETKGEDYANKVTAGYGIGYLYGILGVVLFVQIMPKILGIDIDQERENFTKANIVELEEYEGSLFEMEKYGFFVFFLNVVLGIILGSIKIPISSTSYFSFGASGGTLIVGLILGHFGHISHLSLKIPKQTLNFFRELGLILFLVGAGVPGGINFAKYVRGLYFLYGFILTTVPMIVGFLFGKFVFKFSIFNNLGSITGSMTSTPALGSLIAVAGTDDVSSAYAASYPVALALVVISANLMVSIGV